MKITVNSKDFQTNFLSPLMEINKSGKTPIFVDGNDIHSISTYNNNYVYLYNRYTPVEISGNKVERFNINLDKLKKAISCISSENQFIDLNIENNMLQYKDDFITANIRLIEDSVVAVPKFNVDVFNNLNFTFKGEISESKIEDIKRAMDFARETSKFYISEDNGKIFVSFTDKQTGYSDDIKIMLTDKFEGGLEDHIYDTTILRLISKFSENITLNIGDRGVCVIKIANDNFQLNYITTQLKK